MAPGAPPYTRTRGGRALRVGNQLRHARRVAHPRQIKIGMPHPSFAWVGFCSVNSSALPRPAHPAHSKRNLFSANIADYFRAISTLVLVAEQAEQMGGFRVAPVVAGVLRPPAFFCKTLPTKVHGQRLTVLSPPSLGPRAPKTP
jgi:hypothetical protein